MKPLAFNLRSAKKIAGDKNSSTFHLENGHKIMVAHAALPALQRKQIERMPVHLDEGGAPNPNFQEEQSPDDLPSPPAAPAAPPQDIENNALISANMSGAKPEEASPVPATPAPASLPMPQAPTKGAPSAPSGGGVDLMGAYNQGQRGISEAEQAAKQNADANAGTLQKDLVSRQQLNNDFQKNLADFQTHQKQAIQDYAAGHIDPKHFQENMGTGQKVATAIGLLLGGFTGGFNHTGVNPAADWLKQQQDRDIESQKADIDKKKTLLGANQDLYKDSVLAEQATRINMNDMLDHQIQLQAAKTGSLTAKAAADQLHSKFAMENAATIQNMTARKTFMDAMTKTPPGTKITADPAEAVRYLVPEPHQKEVFGEIERAQNTRTMGDSILAAFDQAAKDNTALRTGGGMLRTPPSVLALHQAMQPTFSDLEGTVRQAAMDNTFHNISPAAGDFDSTTKTKREALVNYLHSKASAPTAKGFGLDLDKFASTKPLDQAPQIQTMNGAQYQKVPGGWKRVQ